MTIWYKNNKANEKYSEEDIIEILKDTLEWVEENNGEEDEEDEKGEKGEKKELILLKTQVDLYMLKEHGVSHETCRSWLNTIHNENKSITGLWSAISLLLENRIVFDKNLRPNIQALVLQSKHNYRERKDIEQSHLFTKMPSVQLDGEDMEIKIGD